MPTRKIVIASNAKVLILFVSFYNGFLCFNIYLVQKMLLCIELNTDDGGQIGCSFLVQVPIKKILLKCCETRSIGHALILLQTVLIIIFLIKSFCFDVFELVSIYERHFTKNKPWNGTISSSTQMHRVLWENTIAW